MRPIRGALVLVGVAVMAGAVASPAAPAAAHSAIVASTPEEGETLTALPEDFSVTANETLLDLEGSGAFALQVLDAEGRYYGDGCVRVVDDTMSATAALGPAGDYVMLWQIVSGDGHPVSGSIAFSWAPDGTAPQSVGGADPPRCGGEAAPEPDGAPSDPGVIVIVGVALAVLVLGGLAIWAIARATRKGERRGERATSRGSEGSSGSSAPDR